MIRVAPAQRRRDVVSYLPGFRFDLFLSYRHDADQGPVKWVSTFRERVHTSLKLSLIHI